MCGIIVYSGHRPAVPLVMDCLKRLEYRGYDSAGLAYIQQNKLQVIRSRGKLNQLEEKMGQQDVYHATAAIAHTRWATHGLPTEINAHPHTDNNGELALVHNGIIENFQEIRTRLAQEGYTFQSETDTEAMLLLISQKYNKLREKAEKENEALSRALSQALQEVEGSYALALINLNSPNEIWGARHSSPLILGAGTGENFIASDIPAFLPYTKDVVFLEDGELAKITANDWEVFSATSLAKIDKQTHRIDWNVQSAQKSGYKHFMLKEIMEQPQVIKDCMAGRIDSANSKVVLPELDHIAVPEQLHIVACGTSYHAGLWAKYIFESWSRIPVHIDIASEFRYRDNIFRENDLVLAITQSGETADTLAGLRIAREQNVPVVGLCNVMGSSVARESDGVIYTQAGPEISVASTKAMCSQMAAFLLLALYWGESKGTLSTEFLQNSIQDFISLPGILNSELARMQESGQEFAAKYSRSRSFFFLGRGINYPLALEGALKLKEISYIHAEGYAAGEMKHGPIALIDPEFPTLAIAPHDDLYTKLISNLQEVKARSGPVIGLTHPGSDLNLEDKWEIPKMWSALNSFLILPALQLFAYEMAVYLGKDVDQPRNLAKSVTVE